MRTLKSAFEHPTFSLALMGNVMSIIRDDLIEAGIRTFPVITLIADHGQGKTEIMRAVTLRDQHEDELTFFIDPREIRRELKNRRDKFAYIDDFAKLTTSAGLERQKKVLDEFVRAAHAGTHGILGITMERATIGYLSESCRSRMLFVDIGNGVNVPETSELLTDLQLSTKLDEFLASFRRFYATQEVSFMERLISYRRSFDPSEKVEQRTISKIFIYRIAAELVSNFLVREGHGPLEPTALQEIERRLFEQEKLAETAAEVYLENSILHRLIMSGRIHPQRSAITNECTYHLNYGCKYRCIDCCDNSSCEREFYTPSFTTSYTPSDFFLHFTGRKTDPVLLVEHPNLIPGFHSDFKFPPFLVIGTEALVCLMNEELERYAAENRSQSFTHFSSQRTHQRLFQCNRCAAQLNGNSYRYTFTYLGFEDEKMLHFSCMMILLTEEEVAFLSENNPLDSFQRFRVGHHAEDTPKILEILHKIWPHMLTNAGPVGGFSTLP